jgi:hypothetical protein
MLHIVFNYRDPLVQLRLGALLAVVIIIVCLGALEFTPQASLRLKLLSGVALLLSCLIVGYALVALRGV